MSFFHQTFGFDEMAYPDTQAKLQEMAKCDVTMDGKQCCVFTVGDRTVNAGKFYEAQVCQLRKEVQKQCEHFKPAHPGKVTVTNFVGESRSLHSIPEFKGGVFQAASQFNYLEFPSQRCVPENGITGYMYDRTQGPACAMACAAGTAFRNYLVKQIGKEASIVGQNKEHQLNGLHQAHMYLKEQMKETQPLLLESNGYVDALPERLQLIDHALKADPKVRDEFIDLIRIGVHEDTAVTDIRDREVLVTQCYCSALSISYSRVPDPAQWASIASAVLNATYEATLLVAVLLALREQKEGKHDRPFPVLLTKVGGGVFGNDRKWIVESIERAVDKVRHCNVALDIRVVHYGSVEFG